jgi:hypothetical protein
MRILVILLILMIASPCYAKVVLYRYTDKATGDEMGICYGHEGNPPVTNPDWDVEVIDETLKKHYMTEHRRQIDKKIKDIKDKLKEKKDKAKLKLKDLGFKDDEIEVIIN